MTRSEKYIRQRLFEKQDNKYRDFQCSLMPTVDSNTVIGVRTPVVRELAREIAKTDMAEEFMLSLPHKYYEENNIHACLIEKIKDYDRILEALDAFLPYVDNWATCDMLSPKAFNKNLSELIMNIEEWLSSSHTYTIRFGLKMLMSFYMDVHFSPEYLELAARVSSSEYYVNMMRAWYFATGLAKQYDAALIYIKERRLDKWTHNKTIQKALESYRISDNEKTYLRALKIK